MSNLLLVPCSGVKDPVNFYNHDGLEPHHVEGLVRQKMTTRILQKLINKFVRI